MNNTKKSLTKSDKRYEKLRFNRVNPQIDAIISSEYNLQKHSNQHKRQAPPNKIQISAKGHSQDPKHQFDRIIKFKRNMVNFVQKKGVLNGGIKINESPQTKGIQHANPTTQYVDIYHQVSISQRQKLAKKIDINAYEKSNLPPAFSRLNPTKKAQRALASPQVIHKITRSFSNKRLPKSLQLY